MKRCEQAPLVRMLALAWRVTPRLVFGAGVLVTISAVCPFLTAYYGQEFLDALVQGDRQHALAYLIGEGLIVATAFIVVRLQGIVRALVAHRVNHAATEALLDGCAKAPMLEMESSHHQSRLHLVRAGIDAHAGPSIHRALQMMQHIFTVAIGAMGLIGLHPSAGLALLCASIALLVLDLRAAQRKWAAQDRLSGTRLRARYLEQLLTQSTSARELRALGASQRVLRERRALAEQVLTRDAALHERDAAAAVALLFGNVCIAYAFYYGMAEDALEGRLSAGMVVYGIALFRSVSSSAVALVSAGSQLSEDALFLGRFWAVLDAQPWQPALLPAGLDAEGPAPEPTRRGLRLNKVTFRYPGAASDALNEVTVSVERGTSLAVVGANGAGKSSLARLMLGLYEPTGGTVELDGVAMAAIRAEGRPAAVVLQDFSRFEMSVRDNLSLSAPGGAEPEESDLWEALRLCRLENKFRSQAWSLDTVLGSQDGCGLSVGEWQKLAVGRALVARTPLLVVDEPTSMSDSESESEILRELLRPADGQVRIVFTHRVAVARLATRIAVIEGGRLVECGGHEELMESGGRYSQLYSELCANTDERGRGVA